MFWRVVFCLLVTLLASESTTSQSISLQQVDGLVAPGYLDTDELITFHLRLASGTNSLTGISNGYRIFSPDGASWTQSSIDTTGAIGSDMLDGGIFLGEWSITGSGADTLMVKGLRFFAPGIPSGTDVVYATIDIGPLSDSDAGKTVCLDSTWYPLSGDWMWWAPSGGSIVPMWSGPHCFEIGCPSTPDTDSDGVGDVCDNCSDVFNPNQEDADSDGSGDVCDECTDTDGDGYGDPGYTANTCGTDNCPAIYNPGQADSDGDGVGDACEAVAHISVDSVHGAIDENAIAFGMCQFDIRYTYFDSSASVWAICNGYRVYSPDGATWELLRFDTTNLNWASIFDFAIGFSEFSITGEGADTVGFTGGASAYPGMTPGFDTVVLELELETYSQDIGRTICLDSSFMPTTNEWTWYVAGEGAMLPDWSGPYCYEIGCPATPDIDGDGVGDSCDNCPDVYNPEQEDADADGIGDTCDNCTDTDGDGYGDPGYAPNDCETDNCPTTYNPDQTDSDGNGEGDACQVVAAVTLDSVHNAVDANTLPVGVCQFDLRYTYFHPTALVESVVNGYRVYSPDGAKWKLLRVDTTAINWKSMFNFIPGAIDTSRVGEGADTIGLFALSLPGSGMPPGLDTVVLELELRTLSQSIGRTLCIDSSWFPPIDNTWLWQTTDLDSLAPSWSGPYCWEIWCPSSPDSDGDGIGDVCDNCPDVFNPNQEDADADGVGDSCYIARVWWVSVSGCDTTGDGTQSSPFASIQHATDMATDLDTVMVCSGTYSENVSCTKGLSIIGEGRETTFIDGSGSGPCVSVMRGALGEVSGFTLRNGSSNGELLVVTNVGNWEVRNNDISGSYIGCVLSGDTIVAERNVFVNNTNAIRPAGTHCIIYHNTFRANYCGVNQGNSVDIQNNIFIDGSTGVNFWLVNGLLSADYNVFWNNIRNYQGDYPVPGTHDTNEDPLLVGGDPYDHSLQWNSPCIDAGNPGFPLDPDSTRADIGAYYFDQIGWDCCQLRGDVNHDGAPLIDIADLVWLVDFMFVGGPEPPCWDEGDVDGSDVEPIDVGDLVYLVDYMFTGGPEPPPCP